MTGAAECTQLDGYCREGSGVGVHPELGLPGIMASTGSLGHGLSLACGVALAHRERGIAKPIFVVLGDGEIQEGSVWEAVLAASSLGLSQIVAIVDCNGLMSTDRVIDIKPSTYPLLEKFSAFGWNTMSVDGHDVLALASAMANVGGGAPLAIVAQTIKGKGVNFFESNADWHYRSISDAEYLAALAQLT
jgi:transketolase